MQPGGPISHFFVSQRLRLHYAEWGDPEAPPLILQHGGRDHCRSWDWVARDLARDWRVLAPDLRGHGDSAWSTDGNYTAPAFTYDFAQFVHQLGYQRVTIVGHSLGGNIATRFTGLYPEMVEKLVNIEGLGPSPVMLAERQAKPYPERMRTWIAARRAASGRLPRRYATPEDAEARMQAANAKLSAQQVRHLTRHGLSRNEDGSWSWKFDPALHVWPPFDNDQVEVEGLWRDIACPVLLLYGADSWASNPDRDGRAAHFRDARVIEYEGAGHWLHHDRLDRFLSDVREFLSAGTKDRSDR